MMEGKATAEITDDGKHVICRSASGRVKWTRDRPSSKEWTLLAKHPVLVQPEEGLFQYVGDEIEGVIIAVFTPGRSMDFNLTYAVENGNLIAIHEAR